MCVLIRLITDNNTTQILDLISNTKVCYILKTVYAANNCGIKGQAITEQAKLPPVKFYPLMSMLQEESLIEKRNRKYFITFLGRVVYNAKRLVEKAVNHQYELKVIDSLKEQQELPEPDLQKIIDTLIDDHQLKDILNNHELNLDSM